MEWTIENILNMDNKITWSFVAGSETLDKSSKTYTLTNEANVKAFTAYIDSLDITEADKKKLKTDTRIPQRTHVGDKQDDLLNNVSKVFAEISAALNQLGNSLELSYQQYYKVPAALSSKINQLSELRTNDIVKNEFVLVNPEDYNKACKKCMAEADTNQMLYELAASDFHAAVDGIKACHDSSRVDKTVTESLKTLRHVLQDKMGTERSRMCYFIDMNVVAQCRSDKNIKFKKVLCGIESLLEDVYNYFDLWITSLFFLENLLYINECEKIKKQK